MFVNIDVNIFLPRDIDKFLSSNKTLSDVIDDEPETLEKHQYFVSPPILKLNN